MTEEMYITI